MRNFYYYFNDKSFSFFIVEIYYFNNYILEDRFNYWNNNILEDSFNYLNNKTYQAGVTKCTNKKYNFVQNDYCILSRIWYNVITVKENTKDKNKRRD